MTSEPHKVKQEAIPEDTWKALKDLGLDDNQAYRAFQISLSTIGPTSKYSDGKICDGDEGDLNIACAADPSEGVVVVHFGKVISWMALGRTESFGFARMLMQKANELPEV